MEVEIGGQTDAIDSGDSGAQGSAMGAMDGQGADQTDASAQPAYTPNYGYKYVSPEGDDVSGELPDIFKPLVKDADTEKMLRDLHEKSSSLDFIKSGRARAQQEREAAVGELNELKAGLGELRQYVESKDLESFFGALQIPEQLVLEYALAKAQYAQMSPEQRASYDAQVNHNKRMVELERQNRQLQEQYSNATTQAREVELDMVLGRPDVSQVAQAFDMRVGRQGAFKAEVIRRGQHYALTANQDVPAEAVVGELLGLYSPLVAQAAQPVATVPGMVQASKKPVIPNIAGKGASPVKAAVRSIADLRRRAAELS
jgi:hypothetical protein